MKENKAFLAVHAALFVVVLIGFTRTFYLSQWFGQPLLASIAIIGPAFARLAFWPMLGGSGVAGGQIFAVAGMLSCMMTLAAYDRLTLGRVHRATWGGIAIVFLSIGIGTGLGLSGLGFNALKHLREFP